MGQIHSNKMKEINSQKQVYKDKTLSCQTWQSICSQNLFFMHLNKKWKNNSGLSLCEMIELVY